MQLYLEMDELNLLADVLMKCAGALSATIDSANTSSENAKQELRNCNAILDKVLARDLELDSDELQQLADLLANEMRALDANCGSNSNRTDKYEHRRSLLACLAEKVDECCVMF